MGFKPHHKIPPFLLPIIRYGLLVLLSTGCYWHALPGSFVFDDSVAIVKNADVVDRAAPLAGLFRHDFWGTNLSDPASHKSYRPLTVLSFRAEVQTFGLDATRMKTTNFVLHTVIGLLLPSFFRVVAATDGGERFRGESYLAAVLFVVHPIHTEAVSGIVGRAELLATFWFVTAVLVYGRLIRARECSQTWLNHVIVLTSVFLLTILSVLCKETGITILVTCAALDILSNVNLHNPLQSLASRRLIVRVAILLTATGTIVYGRLWLQNFTRPQFRDKDNPVAVCTGLTWVLSQSYLYALNAWLLLCPDWLSFDWALESIRLVEGFGDFRAWAGVSFYLGLVLVGVGNVSRGTGVLKGLALTIIPFLPASGIVRVGFVIAERILYIPSLGFCYLIAVGFYRLLRVSKGPLRTGCGVGMVLTCALLAARTHQRSSYWANEHLLFRSALRVVPGNAKVHYNIARLATDEGDRQTAFKFYRQAIDLYPEYEAAHMNLGNLYRDEGNYKQALKHLKKSIEIHGTSTAWMNLGIVHAATKNHAEALVCYQKALQKQKHYPNCVFNLGNLYNDMGNASLALATWNETVRQEPRHIKAWNNMINVYDNANLQQEILTLTSRALNYLPQNPTLLSSRATALAKLNRFLEAEQIYAQLIHAHPTVEKYLQNMGVLYHRWGKLDKAERLYRKALALNPGSDMAKANLAKLLSVRRVPREISEQ